MIAHDCIQGSETWHSLRAGIPTASEFSKLVTSAGAVSKQINDYALVLAAEKYAGKMVDGFGGNKFTERGKELESFARSDYEMSNQVYVEEVGFCTNNLMQYGASPDGFVNKDGSVEFKCKIAKEHLKALFRYKDTGTIPTEYFAQTQGVMLVTGRKYCDLVFFHPDLPGLTVRQYPDKEFLKVLRRQLKAVEVQRNIYLEKLRKI